MNSKMASPGAIFRAAFALATALGAASLAPKAIPGRIISLSPAGEAAPRGSGLKATQRAFRGGGRGESQGPATFSQKEK